MHKSRLEAPGSAMWSTQVANWLQTLQTDVTRLWRRVPQVPDPALGIVPEYRPDGTVIGGGGGGGSAQPVVRFRNDALTDAPAYGVMQISGAVVDATSGERIVTVIQPDKFGSQYDVLVNGDEPVVPGALGSAQSFGGPVAALYNSGDGTPGLGECWGPRSGDWLLRKSTGGFRIAGNPLGGSVVCTQAPWIHFRGKTVSTLALNTYGSVTIYFQGVSVSVAVDVFNAYDDVDAGKWVTCAWIDGQWEVITAEC